MDLLNPVADAIDNQLTRPTLPSADRALRVGVLGNSKPNSLALLTEIRDALLSHGFASGPTIEKIKAPIPANDEMIRELVEDSDLVLVGSAD